MRVLNGLWVALRKRQQLTAFVAAGLVVLLVLAATGLGLRLPGLGFVDLFHDRTNLDYQSRYLNEFAPLRESFIDQQLGAGGRTYSPGRAGTGSALDVPAEPGLVSVEHQATNDAFQRAYVVPSVPFTAKTSTDRAGREPGEPSSCSPTGGTVWYRYTPHDDATLFANTLGTTYAAALGVFSGTTLNGLRQVGCNVDKGDSNRKQTDETHPIVTGAASSGARVVFRAYRRRIYYFQIASPTGGGSLVFSLELLHRTTRLVHSTSGGPSDGPNFYPAISADGRYVAFQSSATNLVPNQPPCPLECSQVFVYDRRTHALEMISVTPAGRPGNGLASAPSISGDGRYVAFESSSTDLLRRPVKGCPTGSSCTEAYVRDRLRRTTEIVSVSASGGAANQGVYKVVSISADGRSVGFASQSTNLARDTSISCSDVYAYSRADYFDNCSQVYVHDRATKKTELVSVTPDGKPGRGNSETPSLSADGRFVAFDSQATTLVRGDANDAYDVFVRDRVTHRTELVSLTSSGKQGQFTSYAPQDGSNQFISADGRFIVFPSVAALVKEDTNNLFDMYVRDRLFGKTTRVSVSSSGEQGNNTSEFSATISRDGRFVAFDTAAGNLVQGDSNGFYDVFVHDMHTGSTVLASMSSTGEVGNNFSQQPAISPDGKVVVFWSTASNLTSDGSNPCVTAFALPGTSCPDLFVHDGRRTI
jgi:Tol biopolymer transport system component